VITQENRSFDHYFGTLNGVRGFGDRFPIPQPGGRSVWEQLDRNGNPVLPYHPYTRASVKAVAEGDVTRFDIEVFPTFGKIAAGHSLRLTLTTSDTPHLGFTPDQLQNLAGGVYQVQRSAAAASFVELPLAAPGSFAQTCSICVKAGS
jgi:hypothetical protein